MFGDAAGVSVEPVHYKAPATRMGGLLGGDIPAMFATVALAPQT